MGQNPPPALVAVICICSAAIESSTEGASWCYHHRSTSCAIRGLPIDWTIDDRLIELLRECPRFDKLASYGVSGSTVRAEDVPFRLASVCLDSEGQSLDSQLIEDALRDLRSYIADDEVWVSARGELFGYWADGPVQITENLQIVTQESGSFAQRWTACSGPAELPS
jgi:hypothetical protein